MNPVRLARNFLRGLWLDLLDRLRPLPDPGPSAPLPPRIPPEALAKLRQPDPPATTRVVAEPLRGSLADRLRLEKRRPR